MATVRELDKRNFVLGVINGALFQLSATFVDSGIVLAPLVLMLMGPSTLWQGILVSLMGAGWAWPQPLLGNFFERRARRLPYYWGSSAARLACSAAAFAVVAQLDGSDPVRIYVLLTTIFFLYASSGSVGVIPFFTIVSDSMPPDRRGLFFGLRWLFGGLLAFGAGFLVKAVLSDRSGLPFPHNYATLFAINFGVLSVSVLAFSLTREPEHAVLKHRVSVWQQLHRSHRLLKRNRSYRLLMIARSLGMMAGGLCPPFLVHYARREFGLADEVVGIYVAISALSAALANLLWSRLGDRYGNRRVLLVSHTLALLTPVLALTAQVCPQTILGSTGVAVLGVHLTWPLALMALVFLPLGFATSGSALGQTNYLLDIAPEGRRGTYLGASSGVTLPLTAMPLVGALAIGTDRFTLGFALAAVLGLAAWIAAYVLEEPRVAQCANAEAAQPNTGGRLKAVRN